MWKLRQHLLTHARPVRRSNQPVADHQYADTSGADSVPNVPHARQDDHPYATPPTSTRNLNNDSEAKSNVSKDHSYGTPYEPDTGGSNSQDRRYDHPYSAPSRPTRPRRRETASDQEAAQAVDFDHHYSCKPDPVQAPPSETPPKGAAKRKALLQTRRSKKSPAVVPTPAPLIVQTPVSGKIAIPSLHKRPKRNSESGFPCDQCNKVFPQRYRRVRHVREVHDKEKLHQCSYCEKSFFKVRFFSSNIYF